MPSQITNLPERIQKRLETLQREIDHIISGAKDRLKTELPNPIQLQFLNLAPCDVLTEYERAQSISFLTRFDHLLDYTIKIVEHHGANFIANMDFLRHALNEFRPLIQNERDSVYYKKIHAVWYAMLTLDDPEKGTTIRVFDEFQKDVTSIFTRRLCERNKAISYVLRLLDYKYLYNGILQHSDGDYSQRFLQDYTSGELHYVLWKHVHCLRFIREMLASYYQLLKFLTSPRLGPL